MTLISRTNMSCRHELETKTRRDGDVTCISLISIGLNMKESETEIEKKKILAIERTAIDGALKKDLGGTKAALLLMRLS